ncbi:unnamed protein product [Acanthoscelides obtectus]|uniref:Uncharacterized protein n=1 Tax=Acanthoscelides obtectus TaxID=200917 RepID=A0A9P0NTV0_ACAOB|nr:unnamed protein product [Acanthoscelides obtectus]CAK1668006.1 hypothetical protein AOBTE_LOCUS26180 [Acanthoscelides obtectus]
MILKFLIFYILLDICLANNYDVRLKSNSPVVKGGTVTFQAEVYYNSNLDSSEFFKYIWEDDAIPDHRAQNMHTDAHDTWSVTYNASIYPAGDYIAQVVVKKCLLNLFCYEIGSQRIQFSLTETLNGNLSLKQGNITREDAFVSNTETVLQTVELKKSDMDYISKAPVVLTYWFVDCTYYGITPDFKFRFNFTQPDTVHTVDALVMADFTPLPPTTTPAPSTTTTSTTTTKPTTTTKATTTTPKPTTKPTIDSTTTKKPVTSITTVKPAISSVHPVRKRSVPMDQPSNITANITSVHLDTLSRNPKIIILPNGPALPHNIPFVCNSSEVSTDEVKSFGYFSKKINVKAPLSHVNVSGNNWLQPGDLLSLKVSCKGSKNIEYCVEYTKGEYNVTGNETCTRYIPLDTCSFSIKRYLSNPKNTILIILKNEVSKIVTPVTVNIYKVNKQPQLSVIVVPVSFSLVAVVLIVFGIAYYFQNRSRFLVEVADFNFGQQYSDMEYKTFNERLRDSVMNAFFRGPTPASSEGSVWPPGRKYGSMTSHGSS